MGARTHTRFVRMLPAAAAEALQGAFFLLEARLRQGQQARSLDAAPDDQGTTKTLAGATLTSALGVPLVATLRQGRLPAQWGWIGVTIMLGGISLRVRSARTLGASYTRTLQVSDNQTLIDTGPYALIRHPGYAGVLVMWIGYGLAWTSMPSVALSAVPVLMAYARRIAAEEAMLERRLGPAYRQYQRRTARLIPKVY